MYRDDLPAKFSDKYVCKLSILDHCREILELQNNLIREKITHTPEEIKVVDCQDREMADLYIILSEYFRGKSDIVQARQDKFRSIKDREDAVDLKAKDDCYKSEFDNKTIG